MKKELPKVYEPQQVESRIYRMWEDNNCFNGDPDPKKKPRPPMPPAPAPPPCAEPFGLAWYPALSTAAAIASSVALPSTFIELVTRLTEQDFTPSTLDTAFSTCATQAEQVIPLTSNCLICAYSQLKFSTSFK